MNLHKRKEIIKILLTSVLIFVFSTASLQNAAEARSNDDVTTFFSNILQGNPQIKSQDIDINPTNEKFLSWQEIQSIGQRLGISLQMENVTLNEMMKRGGNFLTLSKKENGYHNILSVGDDRVVIESDGLILVRNRDEVENEYSGRAISVSGRNLMGGVVVESPIKTYLSSASIDKVGGTIQINNSAKKRIRVQVWKTSCGCTVGELSSEWIEPGGKVDLQVHMNTAQWIDKAETVAIKTSDPTWPLIGIAIISRVPLSLVPMPQNVTFNAIEGVPQERTLSILMPNNVDITSIDSGTSKITIEKRGLVVIEKRKREEFLVRLAGNTASGTIRTALIFSFRGAEVQNISIPVEARVDSNIQVDPNQLFLGNIKANSSQKRTVVISSQRHDNFSIVALKSSIAGIRLNAALNLPADSHAVEVEVKVPNGAGSLFEQKIFLQLSNGKTLSVPIFGLVDGTNQESQTDLKTQKALKSLKAGMLAPDFQIQDMRGEIRHLLDLRGKKNLLLTFFPKCFTGGCATHLSSLNEYEPIYSKNNIAVWGVSVDPAAGDHGQVEFAKKLGLRFPLLPDTGRRISLLYDATEQRTDMASRMTILIGKDGVIRFVDRDVNVRTHGADLLARMRKLGLIHP